MASKVYKFEFDSYVLYDDELNDLRLDIEAEDPETFSVFYKGKEIPLEFIPWKDQDAIAEKIEEHMFMHQASDHWDDLNREYLSGLANDLNKANGWS